MKWGEYSNDVQFILQWNDSSKNQANKSKLPLNTSSALPSSPNITIESPEKHKDLSKLLKYVLQ